ncbi:MAG: DUF1707 domain-containing protein, partial [Solirubrobacteraceae bacterium]
MTEEPSSSPSGPRAPGGIRASDEDRERLAAELREHSVEGRLSTEELEERLAAAYGARTLTELDALRHDLPVPGPISALTHAA